MGNDAGRFCYLYSLDHVLSERMRICSGVAVVQHADTLEQGFFVLSTNRRDQLNLISESGHLFSASATSAAANRVVRMKRSALLIHPSPLQKILNGSKTWEIRGRRAKKCEQIALIQKGSGTVVGVADLVDAVGPLTRSQFVANARKAGPSCSVLLGHFLRLCALGLFLFSELRGEILAEVLGFEHPANLNLGPAAERRECGRSIKVRERKSFCDSGLRNGGTRKNDRRGITFAAARS